MISHWIVKIVLGIFPSMRMQFIFDGLSAHDEIKI